MVTGRGSGGISSVTKREVVREEEESDALDDEVTRRPVETVGDVLPVAEREEENVPDPSGRPRGEGRGILVVIAIGFGTDEKHGKNGYTRSSSRTTDVNIGSSSQSRPGTAEPR
jgi:hypothetical protein